VEFLAELLRTDYGVSRVLTVTPLSLGPFTRAWRADVETQTGGESWFIKQHKAAGEERLECELWLNNRLGRVGFDLIPNVIPTKSGKLFCTHEERLLSVQPFINARAAGDWLDRSPPLEQCQSAAAALALFHYSCSRLALELRGRFGEQMSSPLNGLKVLVSSAFERASSALDPHDPVAFMVAQHGEAVLSKTSEALIDYPIDPENVLHGDFHPANALFHENTFVAVVDLDYVCFAHAAYDVGYAAYMFARDWRTPGAPGAPSAAKIEAFAMAYNEQAFRCASEAVPQLGSDQLRPFLQLAPALVSYWLLNQYISYPALRGELAPKCLLSIEDAAAGIECPSLPLYI
jgi:Ser/Thr protein kinase RdoA (MazF antagonist)